MSDAEILKRNSQLLDLINEHVKANAKLIQAIDRLTDVVTNHEAKIEKLFYLVNLKK